VVSHDVRETLSIVDYAYIISAGRVIEHGGPDSLRSSDSEWTRQFIDGLADGPVPFHYKTRPLLEDLFDNSGRQQ
jgi:phospholipid/cholesterol/gamma-HCH transport system ATP-binding protein